MKALVLLCFTATMGALIDLDLQFSPKQVQESAQYEISFVTASTVAASYSIRVDFPSAFSIPDSAAFPCYVETDSQEPSAYSCVSSSNQVTISGAFVDTNGSPPTSLQIEFSQMANPPSSKTTDPIGVSILNGSTLVDFDLDNSKMAVTVEPAEMASASLTSDSDVVGADAEWTFAFTPTYSVLANSELTVLFPYWNQDLSPETEDLESYFDGQQALCAGVTNIESSLSCTYDEDSRLLTITNGFLTDTSGLVEFTVGNLRNPPSPTTATGFTISILGTDGGVFEISPSSLGIITSTPNNIINISTELTQTEVSEMSSYTLSFIITNPLYRNCMMKVTVPDSVQFDTTINVEGVFGIETSLLITFGADNSFTIVNGYTAYSTKTYISIRIDAMRNPESTAPSSGFTVQTMTPTNAIIDSGTGGAVTATPGAISQYLGRDFIVAESYSVGVETTYTFEFTITHSIPVNGAVSIEFPSTITIDSRDSSTLCTDVIAGMSTAANCEVIGSTLRVHQGFPTGFSPGRIAFAVDGVTNANKAEPSPSFVFSTHPDTTFAHLIDSKTDGITITADPSPFQSVTITPTSVITGDETTYTFTIETTSTVLQNGYLYVSFPSDIQIVDHTTAVCTLLAGFQMPGGTCEVTASEVRIFGFQSADFLQGTLSFSLGDIKNAFSTKPSGSFLVITYDENDFKIDQSSSGNTVTLTEANELQAASVTPQSFVNGQLTTYRLALTLENEAPADFIVRLEAPSSVKLPSLPSCQATGVIQSITCSLTSSITLEASLTLSSPASSGTSIEFDILNVQNPPTTEPSESFVVTTLTTDGFSIDKKEDSVTASMTTPGQIQDMEIVPSDSRITIASSYTFRFTPVNEHPVGTEIKIQIPSEYIVATISCFSSLLSGLSCSYSAPNITISNGFTTSVSPPSKIDFTIAGLTNPSSQQDSSPWVISSSINSYAIDESTDKTVSFTCSSPCFTCDGLPETCQSCDTSSNFPYLYSDSCHSVCEAGTVDEDLTPEITCVACSSPCVECIETTSKCTSCGGSFPYLYNDTCNAECLSEFYGDGSDCFECVNPCKTCTSASTCTSCEAKNTPPNYNLNTYLHSGECIFECPEGFLENSSTFECDACSDNCKDCETSVDNCISCKTGTKLLNDTCVSSCPTDGTYIETETDCLPCESPCITCTNTVNTCLSCDSGLLFKNQCYDSCPAGTLNTGVECSDCIEPCETCAGNLTICTSCIAGYLLEEASCLVSCSEGYYSDGINCLECDEDCKTCSTSASNCTSCPNGEFLLNSTCITECPSDEYIPDIGVCTPCESPCVTCSTTASNCKSCANGQFLYDGTCVTSCPTGVSITNGTVCDKCSSDCLTCEGDINNCASCQTPLLLEEGNCVDDCTGGFANTSEGCVRCDPVCFTCENSPNNCIACPTNTYLLDNWCYSECPENYQPESGACVEIDPPAECNTGCSDIDLANSTCDNECNVEECAYDNGKCVQGSVVCADGEYVLNSECSACQYPCNSCTGPTECITCGSKDGVLLSLYNNFCYESCPAGTVKSSLACVECDTRCSECQGSASTCTACESPYLLYNNQCIVSCIVGSTVQVGNECRDCNSNCLTCDTDTVTCTSCSSDLVLQGARCQNTCDSGFTTTTSNACKACVGCLECNGATSFCTLCAADKFLYQNECLDTCPIGTYTFNNDCLACPSTCVACSGPNNCSACITGKVYFQGLCLDTCPAGYNLIGSQCEAIVTVTCAAGCTDELLNNSVCDSVCNTEDCNYDDENCIHDGTCSAGKYFDGTTCQSCSFPCKTCTSPSVCTSCQEDTVNLTVLMLYNGSCVADCPSGTLMVSPNCLDCNSNCKECGGTVDTCIECEEFLYEGTCVSSCPADVSIQVNDNLCQACSSNCETCQGSFENCTSCPDGQVLQGSQCLNACNEGWTTTTLFPNTCRECTGDCLTCTQETWNCTKCNGDLFNFQGVCYSECPEKISVVSGDSCLPCQSPCAECAVSTTICTVCDNGFYLHITSCLANCPSGFEPNIIQCEPYCSEGCTQELLNNSVCDSACFTEACTYDKGQCEVDTSCPQGQFRDGDVCSNCNSPCNTCISGAYCSSCQVIDDKQYLLYNGGCYEECPTSTFKSGLICEDCDSSCLNCEMTRDNCIECEASQFLHNSDCKISCPIGTTLQVNTTCIDCDNNCATCEGSTDNCITCPAGSFLYGSECLAECPEGKTTTPSSGSTCVDCTNDCVTCLGLASFCTSCEADKIIHDASCIDECPRGWLETAIDPGICTKCSSDCVTCEGSISFCTECPTGELLTSSNTCESPYDCPEGKTITVDSDGACEDCQFPCKLCSGSVTQCVECEDGLVLVDGTCELCTSPCKTCTAAPANCRSCNDGYYLSGTICEPCSSPCLTCENSSFECTACEEGYILIDTMCTNCQGSCATCLSDLVSCTSCKEGNYLVGSDCVGCSLSCKTCGSSATTCTSCEPGSYLTVANTCEVCDPGCAECEGLATDCTACVAGQQLLNRQCGSCKSECATCLQDFDTCASCPDGQDLVAGSCGICSSNCATCSGDFNTCSSCPDGKFLSNGACIGCDSNCLSCDGSTTYCTACADPLILVNNSCELCDATCKTCEINVDICTSCDEGFSLVNSSCIACTSDCKTCSGSNDYCITCFEGWYISGSQCLKCDSSCKTCENQPQFCTSCPTGWQLSGNECILVCEDGFTLYNGICEPCTGDCVTCAGSPSYCTSCDGLTLYQGSCVSECPEGFFLGSQSCEQCSTSCKTCETSAASCTSCEDGSQLVNGTCQLVCNDGFFYNGSICQACNDNCLTCASSATNCVTCKEPDERISSNGRCEVPCETGFIRVASSGSECVPCNTSCLSCSGTQNYCTACKDSNLNLYDGLCLLSCPTNSTIDMGSYCQDCETPCLTCSILTTNCTSCASSSYLHSETCVSACPVGYYTSGANCVECSDLNNCPPLVVNVTTVAEEEFNSGPVPFPFTGVAVVSGAVMGVTKLAAAGVGFMATAVVVWGSLTTVSWVAILIYVPVDEGRRLFLVSGSDGDMMLSIGLVLIAGALAFHVLCNLIFALIYCRKILSNDKLFYAWRKRHAYSHSITMLLTFFLSFHSVRLLYSALCNKQAFKAKFADMRRLLKPLVRLGYVSMLCCCVPIISALILLILHFDIDDWVWMLSLDSLIMTTLFLLLLVIDTVRLEKMILQLGEDIVKVKDTKNLIPPPDNSVEDLASCFPFLDFKSLVPPTLQWYQKKRKEVLSQSKVPSRSTSPIPQAIVLKRRQSFPLENCVDVHVKGNFTHFDLPILTLPRNDYKLRPDDSLLGDQTMIEDSSGSLNAEKLEFKKPVQKTKNIAFAPLDLQSDDLYCTKMIVGTEESASSEETDEIQDHLLDLDKALADPEDPAVVLVPHLKMGKRIYIRQELQYSNLTAMNGQEIDPRNFDLAATVVDERDVRLVMLETYTGEKVKARREFTGAQIIEVEDTKQPPIVGTTIKHEHDLLLASAYPDPEDPEVIVVNHRALGEDLKVRKSFQGAQIVDEFGEPMPRALRVERNDYEIAKTIIDKEDVHLATLKHRYKNERVKVKRNFVGAKVIGLEGDTPERIFKKRGRVSRPSVEDQKTENLGSIISRMNEVRPETTNRYSFDSDLDPFPMMASRTGMFRDRGRTASPSVSKNKHRKRDSKVKPDSLLDAMDITDQSDSLHAFQQTKLPMFMEPDLDVEDIPSVRYADRVLHKTGGKIVKARKRSYNK